MENYEELFKNIEFSKEDEELKEIVLNFALDEAQKQDNNVGVNPVEIKEILYQSVPYVGILKVLDLLEPTNRILKERGIELPLEKQRTTATEDRFDKG